MHLPASARAATPAARQGALTAAPCPRLPPAAAQQSCWRRLSSGRRSWASPPTPTFRGAHLCLLVGSQPQLCCHRALCRALSRRRHQSWASERRLAAATCRVVNPPTCRVVTPPPRPLSHRSYMRALAAGGKQNLVVDVMLRTLGLDICADTLVSARLHAAFCANLKACSWTPLRAALPCCCSKKLHTCGVHPVPLSVAPSPSTLPAGGQPHDPRHQRRTEEARDRRRDAGGARQGEARMPAAAVLTGCCFARRLLLCLPAAATIGRGNTAGGARCCVLPLQ